MTFFADKYKPIRLSIDIYRNSIVKRSVSYINKIAESKFNGENMRFINQMQPEIDFCQDKMIVDDAIYDGMMSVIKRIEPYFIGFEQSGGGGGEDGGMVVSPERLEFAYLGGTKSFVVRLNDGSVVEVEPDSLSYDWNGGTKTILVKKGGGSVEDSDFHLNLEFPFNWKKQFDIVLRRRIAEYLANKVVAEWLEKVNQEAAGYYFAKSETLLKDVKGTCEMRQGRVHVGWNTTY